jgi:hypothetical protein
LIRVRPTPLNPSDKDYIVFSAKDVTPASSGIAEFPLARIGAGKPLPLKEGLNPAWAGLMADFETGIVKPPFGEQTALTESQWAAIVAKFVEGEITVTVPNGGESWKVGGSYNINGNIRETIFYIVVVLK